MSDPQLIDLTRPGHHGVAATTQLTLRETTLAAAWNLQGDPRNPLFIEQVRRSFGMTLPTAPNTMRQANRLTAMWLGPTSWLLVAGGALSAAPALTGFATQRDAVNGAGGALFDVSAARVAWTLSGPCAGTVLASACPLDFHLRAFAAGTCAQSLFGHVGALLCRLAEDEFVLFVARSLARHVVSVLDGAGAQHGYDVLVPSPFGSA